MLVRYSDWIDPSHDSNFIHPGTGRVHNNPGVKTILRFDDPSVPVTDADIESARAMLDEYAAAVNAIPELDERTIRNTHDLYQRSFEDARRLARDETGDTRRQAHSVAIGLRNLRRDIEQRVYPSLVVLLAREQLEGGEFELSWPEL